MELSASAFRLVTIAAVCARLAAATSAALPQQPPDPRIEVPAARGWIPADPFESGTELGALHRPKGRVRSVTWFQAVDADARAAAKCAWEKRVVQKFDDEGLCVEVERWCCGARVAWKVARSSTGAAREFEQSWGHPLFENPWREESVCDRTGAMIGVVRIPLMLVGREVPDTRPRIARKMDYDEEGRCLRETRFDDDRWPRSIRRWRYDDCGRIELVDDRAGSSQRSREFEYDDEGRVEACTSRGPGAGPVRRSRFEYDRMGRLSSTEELEDGVVVREVAFGYGEDGGLVRRETGCFALSRMASRDIETFDGIDRPLSREIQSADGNVLGTTRWTYEDDSRGNWIRRVCRGDANLRDRDAWREIEYAD